MGSFQRLQMHVAVVDAFSFFQKSVYPSTLTRHTTDWLKVPVSMRMHCHNIKKKGRVRMYAHPVSNSSSRHLAKSSDTEKLQRSITMLGLALPHPRKHTHWPQPLRCGRLGQTIRACACTLAASRVSRPRLFMRIKKGRILPGSGAAPAI